MGSSYLAVLRLPHARPLLLASLVGRLSNATGPLSVVLFVHGETGSLALAGAASAAIALASGLLAPVRGRLVDRYGQRRCLPAMAVAFAAALAGVVAVTRPGPASHAICGWSTGPPPSFTTLQPVVPATAHATAANHRSIPCIPTSRIYRPCRRG